MVLRIAVLICSLVLMVIVGLQSLAVGIGGAIVKQQGMTQGGSLGFLVAFLFLLGAAFVLGKPIVSTVVFILAGLLGFVASATTNFQDMKIWGVISLILALLSYLGHKELNKKKLKVKNDNNEMSKAEGA